MYYDLNYCCKQNLLLLFLRAGLAENKHPIKRNFNMHAKYKEKL